MQRLSKGERIVAITSALLVIFSVFPLWATYSFEGFGTDQREGAEVWKPDVFNALPKLAIVLALVVLLVVALRAAGQGSGWPVGKIYMVLGGLAFLLLLVTLIQGPKGLEEIAGLSDIEVPGFEFNFDVSRGILLYGSVVLAAGIAFGGYILKEQAEGGTVTTGMAVPPPPAV